MCELLEPKLMLLMLFWILPAPQSVLVSLSSRICLKRWEDLRQMPRRELPGLQIRFPSSLRNLQERLGNESGALLEHLPGRLDHGGGRVSV